jgi:AhpD family alkylhydroperoxidase
MSPITQLTNGSRPPHASERAQRRPDDPFLPPVEKPAGLAKRLVYFLSRRQFGKVLTPVKVVTARMPVAFGLFVAKIGKLDRTLTLPAETVMLVREQVARVNGCLFCVDLGRSLAMHAAVNGAKFDALAAYRTSHMFSESERAMLDYATQLTRERKVEPATFDRLARHYSEREICEIVWLVASEHLYNVTNIGLNIHSDMLCDIGRMKR